MNKFKAKIILALAAISSGQLTAFAAEGDSNGNILDQILPRPGENYQYGDLYPEPELEAVGNLPEITPEAAFTTVIKAILSVSMALTLVAICVVGYYYLVNQGDEEDTEKAKDIILYLLIGMAIIAGAYGLVSGVAQFDFFSSIS